MTDPTALLNADGQALLAQIAASDLSELRLGAELRQSYPGDLVAAAVLQHELRTAARAKFTRADQMYFTRAGLEQASAEPVARLRATRFAGIARLADLCCGIGGDLVTLGRAACVGAVSVDAAPVGAAPVSAAPVSAGPVSAAFDSAAPVSAAPGSAAPVCAVDIDPVHLQLAAINAAVYGVEVASVQSDVRAVHLSDLDAVFIDPARRTPRSHDTAGHRMAAGNSEPPLTWCFGLADQVPAVCVKASPALDRAVVPTGWEVEFVALGTELKEAALWSPALAGSTTRASVIVDGRAWTLAAEEQPVQTSRVDAPGEFLLDPNPAVTRAGLVAELAARLGAWQIDARIAFLSADQPIATPFGRSLRVLDSGPWQEKRLTTRLRELDIGALDIRRRGLAGDVEQIRRRFRLAGSRRATVLMTRVRDQPWGFICVDS